MAFSWLINGGDPNHLLTGMILQVCSHTIQAFDPQVFQNRWTRRLSRTPRLHYDQICLPGPSKGSQMDGKGCH